MAARYKNIEGYYIALDNLYLEREWCSLEWFWKLTLADSSELQNSL
jgi:hypothetical protein